MPAKIRMDLDELRVESFSTTAPEETQRGTVHGYELTAACSGYLTCASACSMTNGVAVCKTCGPCC